MIKLIALLVLCNQIYAQTIRAEVKNIDLGIIKILEGDVKELVIYRTSKTPEKIRLSFTQETERLVCLYPKMGHETCLNNPMLYCLSPLTCWESGRTQVNFKRYVTLSFKEIEALRNPTDLEVYLLTLSDNGEQFQSELRTPSNYSSEKRRTFWGNDFYNVYDLGDV